MSIVLHKKPNNIEFSRNEIKLNISNDEYYLWEGEYPQFSIPNTANNEHRINFPLPSKGESILFVCYADSDYDDNYYAINLSAPGTLAEKLNSHPDVRNEYIIEDTGTEIIFTSKTYTHMINDDVGFWNPGTDTGDQSDVITAGNQPSINDDLIMYAELLNPGFKASEGIIFSLEGENPKIQIHEAIAKEYSLPDFSLIRSFPIPEITFLVYEIQNRDYQPRANTKEVNFLSLPGYADESIFDNTFGNSKSVYLNNLNTLKASDTSPLIVNFYIGANYELFLSVTMYYEDGTNNTYNEVYEANANSILQAQAGWSVLEEKYNANKPYKYVIQLTKAYSTTPESVSITVFLQQKNFQEKYFIFYNRYGAPETLRTTGGEDTEKEIERKNYILNNRAKNNFLRSTDIRTVRTGIKHIKELPVIEDILQTEALWVYENGKWLEAEIEGDSYTVIEKSETTINVEFAYRLTEIL